MFQQPDDGLHGRFIPLAQDGLSLLMTEEVEGGGALGLGLNLHEATGSSHVVGQE